MDKNNHEKIIKLLTKNEDEIIEYKVNNNDHERIGKYISALANSSAILNRQFSYIVWGWKMKQKKLSAQSFTLKLKK